MGDLGGYTVSARCCACKETVRVQTWRGDWVDWARHICWMCRQKGYIIRDNSLLSNDNDYDTWEVDATAEQLEDNYKTYKEEQKAEREAHKAREGGTDG